MNGMESFLMIEDALQNLVNSSKTAIIFNGDRIRFYDNYHCEVNMFLMICFLRKMYYIEGESAKSVIS